MAAVLLKLGGYGLLLFQDMFVSSILSLLLVSLSLIGALQVAVLCCQTLDLKVLIAFTSVGHMAFVVVGVASGSCLRTFTALLVLLSHGFRSSFAFYIAFMLYKSSGSRSLVLNKRVYSMAGLITFL